MQRVGLSLLLLVWFPNLTTAVLHETGTSENSPDQLNWIVGVGKSKITPTQPIWLAGYASRTAPSSEVATDLWAKAVLIEDAGGKRVVLITLDLVGIERTLSHQVCQALSDRFSLNRDQISLATSHTHSGPVVGKNLRPMHFYQLTEEHQQKIADYSDWLQEQIVNAVQQAFDSRQPVNLEWSTGSANFATNRRNNPEPEASARRAARSLVGPVDHSVPVMVAKSAAEGKLVAIVFGYACHATVLAGSAISGDYPGYAQLELERRFPDCTAFFWAGCGADQNPLPRRSVELAEHYGRRLAMTVEAVLLTHQMLPVQGSLQSGYAEIPLSYAEVPDRDVWQQRAESTDRYESMRARLLLQEWDQAGALSRTYPYPVQTWRLGSDIEWIHLGGEVVVDYAARLKSERRGERTWVTAYANDVMAYIPSLRVLREGGYEGATAMVYYGLPSSWAENVEETIMAEVNRQLGPIEQR